MFFEHHAPLQGYNTFGIAARAATLLRVTDADMLQRALDNPALLGQTPFILGGGSNIVLTGDVKGPVFRMEIKGIRLVEETDKAWIVEAGAGENWHDCVRWTLDTTSPAWKTWHSFQAQ